MQFEKSIKLKALKLRCLIKRTRDNTPTCIPEVQQKFSSLNREVQFRLS